MVDSIFTSSFIANLALPKLKLKQVVSIDLDGFSKVQTFFDHEQNGKWWLKVSQNQFPAELQLKTLNISFAVNGYIYHAKACNGAYQKNIGKLIIDQPISFDARPIRKHERIDTRLHSAIIIPATDNKSNRYIYRSDNRLLNVSLGGAQLACRDAIPQDASNILMLLSLDSEGPFNKAEQIYCRGTIKRLVTQVSCVGFPFVYGISFNSMIRISLPIIS